MWSSIITQSPRTCAFLSTLAVLLGVPLLLGAGTPAWSAPTASEMSTVGGGEGNRMNLTVIDFPFTCQTECENMGEGSFKCDGDSEGAGPGSTSYTETTPQCTPGYFWNSPGCQGGTPTTGNCFTDAFEYTDP